LTGSGAGFVFVSHRLFVYATSFSAPTCPGAGPDATGSDCPR
jgi:hypothetical protein